MASKKFSEFASALDFLDNWFVVGYDPNEATLEDANKRVTWGNATADLAKDADLAAHTGNSDIHVTAAQSAALDASQNPSGANPYVTESWGDILYAPLEHNHDGDYDPAGSAAAVQTNLDAHEAAASPHSGHLITVNAGAGISIDKTDSQRPVITATGGGGGDVTNPLTADLDIGAGYKIVSGATPGQDITLQPEDGQEVKITQGTAVLDGSTLHMETGSTGTALIYADDNLDLNAGANRQIAMQIGSGLTSLRVYDDRISCNVDLENGANAKCGLAANPFDEGNFDTVAVTNAATVADEAYGPGWDGSNEVPTKNAVYDKIETLGSGGGGLTPVAGPDADTTLVVGNHYFVDCSGWLQNRTYTLPATFSQGDQIAVTLIGANASFFGVLMKSGTGDVVNDHPANEVYTKLFALKDAAYFVGGVANAMWHGRRVPNEYIGLISKINQQNTLEGVWMIPTLSESSNPGGFVYLAGAKKWRCPEGARKLDILASIECILQSGTVEELRTQINADNPRSESGLLAQFQLPFYSGSPNIHNLTSMELLADATTEVYLQVMTAGGSGYGRLNSIHDTDKRNYLKIRVWTD